MCTTSAKCSLFSARCQNAFNELAVSSGPISGQTLINLYKGRPITFPAFPHIVVDQFVETLTGYAKLFAVLVPSSVIEVMCELAVSGCTVYL